MNWYDESDEQDYLVPCPSCKQEIYDEAEHCPYCGNYVTVETTPFAYKPLWFRAVAIAIICWLIYTFVFWF